MSTSRFFTGDSELTISKEVEDGLYSLVFNDVSFRSLPLAHMIGALDNVEKQETNEVYDANTYEWMPF